ncbi:MAG: guanosine monophosphate reductase [Candidatus Marinimicrobia bacterium]|nr:guanosine monophosphate reductase [Candidatus Neomarinimicrobiota bacterium]MBL7023503.1 guanosine monophosphate reductase [Candidatus Neomarinimicrobiota bacterium]MBL7109538.1 guanosine monophosphate reductase [Candidatus Neomarinimicrobiota bacterium]
MKTTHTYKDISLVPRTLSKVHSRNQIDLSTNFNNHKLRMPILPSPMDTICGINMCKAFCENDMIGMIHRFSSDEERINDYRTLVSENMDAIIAVGLEEQNLVSQLHNIGARYFIVDVANGFNTASEPIIEFIKNLSDTFLICGNVASEEGFEYLSNLGVDAIRVGIGNGSMCTTSIMTGVGQGIVSALQECKSFKDKNKCKSLIIADGGVASVGDISKALGLGADLVMMGRMFAGTKESEGNILKYNGNLYKAYRGSASFAVQRKSKKNPYYIEGDETIVEYKGGVQNIIDQIEAGLRSSFSYMGATNIVEFKSNADFVQYHMDQKLFKTE